MVKARNKSALFVNYAKRRKIIDCSSYLALKFFDWDISLKIYLGKKT